MSSNCPVAPASGEPGEHLRECPWRRRWHTVRAYTKSKLANDAGVSAHVIRDYELRGLLSPCKYTNSGYRIYDKNVLQRLRFIVAGKAAGISMAELAALCQAIDTGDPLAARTSLAGIQDSLNRNQKAV